MSHCGSSLVCTHPNCISQLDSIRYANVNYAARSAPPNCASEKRALCRIQLTELPGPASGESSVRTGSPDGRPLLHVSRSFSRLESVDGSGDPLASSLSRLRGEPPVQELPDGSDNEDEDEDGNPLGSALLPEGFDDLPPELIALADRLVGALPETGQKA